MGNYKKSVFLKKKLGFCWREGDFLVGGFPHKVKLVFKSFDRV